MVVTGVSTNGRIAWKLEAKKQSSGRLLPCGDSQAQSMQLPFEDAIEIRPANLTDVPAMKRVVADAYRKYIERIGKPPAPMLDDYAMRVCSHTAWVAESCGTITGLIVLLPKQEHLLLDNVAVDPIHQGLGVGRALLRIAEDEAVRQCYAELRLYMRQKMTENLTMCLALGWVEAGRGKQDGYQQIFFRKQLDR